MGMNETTARIVAGNFDSGMPKIMVVLTDGNSFDDVAQASAYANSLGITLISVGIGSNVNVTQLL